MDFVSLTEGGESCCLRIAAMTAVYEHFSLKRIRTEAEEPQFSQSSLTYQNFFRLLLVLPLSILT